LLSFEGEIGVKHALCDKGTKVEFSIDDGSIVNLSFSETSCVPFSAEASKALAELAG
jgi:hypothetical protein